MTAAMAAGITDRLWSLEDRVAHHEPLYFDLPKHHLNILTLTHWLSPVVAEWAEKEAGFASAYDEDLARVMLKPNQRAHQFKLRH